MEKPSRIAANLAAAAVVASLFGVSVFADSRHRDETNRGGRAEEHADRFRREDRAQQPSTDASRLDRRPQQTYTPAPQPSQSYDRRDSRQSWDRNRGTDAGRSYDGNRSYDDNRSHDGNRSYNDNRSNRDYSQRNGGYNSQHGYGEANRGYDRHDNRGYGNYGRNDSHHQVTMQGRITRMNHEHGGYRVWLDHGGYSYWVPEARFNLWPLRIGLNIRLGGWWDPLGYVNVYDMGPIGGPYYTSGDLRGIVESVDYRRGTAVIRDDLSGSFVTILLRGGDPRLGQLRPGDYAEISGAWSRSGLFEAYNLIALGGGNAPYGYGY